jgi:hypothetical protein
MTRQQKRTLANAVLSSGYDNLCEFWGEITRDLDLPPFEVCQPVLHNWHRRLIDLANNA